MDPITRPEAVNDEILRLARALDRRGRIGSLVDWLGRRMPT